MDLWKFGKKRRMRRKDIRTEMYWKGQEEVVFGIVFSFLVLFHAITVIILLYFPEPHLYLIALIPLNILFFLVIVKYAQWLEKLTFWEGAKKIVRDEAIFLLFIFVLTILAKIFGPLW